ncbi:hypothetical protein A2685_01210 [Candidatus Woesebacteria bacterium RIFCSPHIGHO2_01_FULL_37_10]|uniref:Uncharacterized protein n=1 Tax=Candidatus Woesebacteria bacterium RIFCSPHIGHO2_01_FULL_37_10 TaxID=1802489 RepID=A0A1F7XW37_9BACT|nr:MAG: hypothetical protein A2685_01210 [Candidatus Woesebacteria bacterium RIFCSPHIGHO2_01_FULL_37_10]
MNKIESSGKPYRTISLKGLTDADRATLRRYWNATSSLSCDLIHPGEINFDELRRDAIEVLTRAKEATLTDN